MGAFDNATARQLFYYLLDLFELVHYEKSDA